MIFCNLKPYSNLIEKIFESTKIKNEKKALKNVFNRYALMIKRDHFTFSCISLRLKDYQSVRSVNACSLDEEHKKKRLQMNHFFFHFLYVLVKPLLYSTKVNLIPMFFFFYFFKWLLV